MISKLIEKIKSFFEKKNINLELSEPCDWPLAGFDNDIKCLKFICSSVGISHTESSDSLRRLHESYLPELNDRLDELKIITQIRISTSHIYSESISGLRYRISIVGMSYGNNLDKELILNIFQDIIDDFSQIGMEIEWRD